jgi:hypothetical protein
MELEKRINQLEYAVKEYDFIATLRNMNDKELADAIVDGSLMLTIAGHDRQGTRLQSCRVAEWDYRNTIREGVGVDGETLDKRIADAEQEWADQENIDTTQEAGITLTNGSGI